MIGHGDPKTTAGYDKSDYDIDRHPAYRLEGRGLARSTGGADA